MTSTSTAPEELGEKIKRPMNAFILWSRERRRELANEDPNMHNFEISKRLGMEWNRLDAKDKKQFYDEAQKLKEEHRKNYPDYKYHPRRKPRRRFTPINQSPAQFQMTYFLPPEKRYPCQPGYSTFPRNHWFTNLPSIPSSSTEIMHNQLEMRYFPQSHFVMNGGVPIPATYYGIHDIPTALSAPLQQRKDARFSAGGLLKREELLRRAAESSLEYRMQGKDETTERSLETNKHAVYHDTSGFHRQVSPTHVCLGCQGGVTTFYQGIRSPTAASS